MSRFCGGMPPIGRDILWLIRLIQRERRARKRKPELAITPGKLQPFYPEKPCIKARK